MIILLSVAGTALFALIPVFAGMAQDTSGPQEASARSVADCGA